MNEVTPDDGRKYDEVGLPITRTDEIRLRNKMLKGLFLEEVPEFWDWLQSVSRFGNNPIDAMELDRKKGGVYKATLFTEDRAYNVTATTGGYLGATMSLRKPRAGEDWTRGTDLADGDYSSETWYKILTDVLAVELVRLGK